MVPSAPYLALGLVEITLCSILAIKPRTLCSHSQIKEKKKDQF